MSTDEDGGTEFAFYHYVPSIVAAAIFTILFFLISLLHLHQLLRTQTWFFIPFMIGGFMEAIGYIGRLLSAHESPDYTEIPYIMQSILLLIAPSLIAASIYMELGRIMKVTKGEAYSIFSTRYLTKIFVAGDVISFIMQATGGAIMATNRTSNTPNHHNQEIGEKIIIASLILQIAFFTKFILTTLLFHIRMLRHPTSRVLRGVHYIPWREHILALYIGSVCILIRSLFRTVEYAMGGDAYLMRNEWAIYVFDAVMMMGVMGVFAWRHPSEIDALLKKGRGRVVRNFVDVRSLV